jgi:peptide/nickel transport system substrate-binding protein
MRIFLLPSLPTPFLRRVGLFILCIILVVSCNGHSGKTPLDSSAQGRITIGTTLKPRTLDPADNYEVAAMNLIYNMGNQLYTYDAQKPTELVPQLATALPTVSDDGLTYRIPLRQGVTFHDGTPFDAEAMAFSLQRFMKNGGKPSFLLDGIIQSVEATAPDELTLVLKQPFAAFPSLLAFPGACAVSPKAYAIGPGKFEPNIFVGTGPYQLGALTEDSVRLDVFENYWGDPPQNQGINLQIYANNPANLFNSFQTRAIDVAYLTLDPEQVQALLKRGNQGELQTIDTPGIVVTLMALNLKQPPLDRLEVRQAIATLIDRKFLMERALKNQADPIYSLIATTFEAYTPAFQTAYAEGDFTAAKNLLKTAGYSAENPAIVELWYAVGSPVRDLVAVTLKAIAAQNLEGLLQFELNTVEPTTAFSNLPKGIYPTFMFSWYPDFLDPDNYIEPFLGCIKGTAATGCEEGGSKNQGSFYWNDRVNDLIEQERKTIDPEKRLAIFAEIQKILAEDIPYIPLWQDKDYAFAQNGIEGVKLTLSQNFPFWTIKNQL